MPRRDGGVCQAIPRQAFSPQTIDVADGEDAEVQQAKILLVADGDGVDFAAKRLREAGHEVVTRRLAIGTAASIVRERPDLVLWDVTMPLVSLPDVAALRSNPRIPRFTLVVYARGSRAELQAFVETCAADGYLDEAEDPSALPARVRSWLPRAARRKARSGTSLRARHVVVAGEEATQRRLRSAVERECVLRVTDAGLEALRWMCSSDAPDLVFAGTSLTDIPAVALARRAADISPRWLRRLVVVDEHVAGAPPIPAGLPQRVWRRQDPDERLFEVLDALRDVG
jgi:CheY-like chemotaxis protein